MMWSINLSTGIGYSNAFYAVMNSSESVIEFGTFGASAFFFLPALFDASIAASLFTTFILMGLTGSVDVCPPQQLLKHFSAAYLGVLALSSARLRSQGDWQISRRMRHDVRIGGISYSAGFCFPS
jgi:hypothetical protein